MGEIALKTNDDGSFEEKLYIPCEVAEMVTSIKQVISKGVDLKEMTGGDDQPMFAAIKLVSDNAIGKGTVGGQSITKRYLPTVISQISEAISPRSNKDTVKLYPGHQEPSKIGHELRKILGAFVGGVRESKSAVGYCYILPGAEDLRDQCKRGMFPPVSIEALVEMKWNPEDKIVDVVKLVKLKGVAVANDADVGVADSRIVKVLQEMKIIENGKEGLSMDPKEEAKKLLQTMSVEEMKKLRPDLFEAIRAEFESDVEVEKELQEMKSSIEAQKATLADRDKEIADLKAVNDKKDVEIKEMKVARELEDKKTGIMRELGGKYSENVVKSLDADIVGKSVEEMETAKDRAVARLEELGIKPGKPSAKTATGETNEMVSGVTGNKLQIGGLDMPPMTVEEAMILKFNAISSDKMVEKKYEQFRGDVIEMVRVYGKHGSDEVRELLNMDIAEMETRSDFPDLLAYGINPLLIDSYFNEVPNTLFQNFFTVFPLSRNEVPFPSLKGFQIGKIVEGEPYPMVSLKAGPEVIVKAEDWGSLLKISHAMIRDSQVDVMKYNVMEVGKAHARKKDEVSAYLLANAAGQIYGPVANTVANLRAARIAGLEIYETDTMIKRPRYYNSLIMSPARAEELLPPMTTTFFQGVAIDTNTGDVKGVAGMKLYRWLWIPDDFCLMIRAKEKMLQAVREGLNIANAHEFSTNSEAVRSNEAFTFAALDGDEIQRVDFS